MSDNLPQLLGMNRRRCSTTSQKSTSIAQYQKLGEHSLTMEDVHPSLAQNPASFSSRMCKYCLPNLEFNDASEFARHLRSVHSSKEGGSYICRYGENNICLKKSRDALTETGLETHVRRVLRQRVQYSCPPPMPTELIPRSRPIWVCDRCQPKIEFYEFAEFPLHLRSVHSSMKGGSHFCRFGENDVCNFMPGSGITSFELDVHNRHIHGERALKFSPIWDSTDQIRRFYSYSPPEEKIETPESLLELETDLRTNAVDAFNTDRPDNFTRHTEDNLYARACPLRTVHSASSTESFLRGASYSSSSEGYAEKAGCLSSLCGKLADMFNFGAKDERAAHYSVCHAPSEKENRKMADERTCPADYASLSEEDERPLLRYDFPLPTEGLLDPSSDATRVGDDESGIHSETRTSNPSLPVQEVASDTRAMNNPYSVFSPQTDGADAEDEYTE